MSYNYTMNMNKPYIKCINCKRLIKNTHMIIKTHKQQENNDNCLNGKSFFMFNAHLICNDCFDNTEHVDAHTDDNGDYPNVTLYINDGKLYFNKKEFKKYTKLNMLINIKNERLQKLMNKLKEMKMVYKKNKLCDDYINSGNPDLDTVIGKLFNKTNEENNRLCQLIVELKKRNLEYNNLVPVYKKYIKNDGDIDKTIEVGELEKILIQETNYLSVLELTDSDTAREISICKASKTTNAFDKYIIKKNTVKFD